MHLSNIAHWAEKRISDNSPAVLTAIGVTGTLTTAFLTGNASFKAAEIIRDAEAKKHLYDSEGNHRPDESPRALKPEELADRELEIKDKVDLVWKLYIPAAGTALLTVFAIIAANRIGTRRAAAMAAAYSVTEKAFTEYKEKVVEKIGEKKALALRDELAQDRINANPVSSREIIITDHGGVLCFEEYSGRYFNSNMEDLRKAQNDLNYQILHSFYASLTDFYNLIGLPRTSQSDELGWNCDRKFELQFSTCMSENDRPCISVGFGTVVPIREYPRVQ